MAIRNPICHAWEWLGCTGRVLITSPQCHGVGSQQLALAVEHKSVDGGSQVHGCYSQVLGAGIQFSMCMMAVCTCPGEVCTLIGCTTYPAHREQ